MEETEITQRKKRREPMTVSRICNRWIQDHNMEHRAASQWPFINSSREDRHVSSMPLMDSKASSRELNQKSGSFAKQRVSSRTLRRRLLQYGL
ncbi:hypothetical protein TNCV_2275521 [Trichonephila clavipes]|nr:hypothetical protein TNCV_2275521 [Trichonephila clavipes]